MHHILIIEDEPRIASFVEKGLRAHGFTAAVAADARTATNLALTGDFDLLLLDLGLPDQDGLNLLTTLRGQGLQVPIIILTARDDLKDKVTGFEEGADDYLTKPFRFEELFVRIKARLRNNISTPTDEVSLVLASGVLQLDLRSHQIIVDGRNIDLPSREFTLAELFFRHPGQVLSREQILNRVWGYDYDPGSNIVDVYVGYLRKKMGGKWIETVRGKGYRLNASVKI